MQKLSWMREVPSRKLITHIVTSVIFGACVIAAGCAPQNHSANEDMETEGETVPIPKLSPAEQAELSKMSEPVMNQAVESQIVRQYSAIDPGHQVPTNLLKSALAYYNANASRIPNKRYLSVVDFKPRSSHSRLFVINMSTGAVWTMHMAHGSGSDPGRSGYATRFSNVSGSLKSSLGYYRTAETYTGKHGRSLRLDGLSSTNSNVRARAIVVHAAAYVYDSNVVQGRSSGCLAVSQSNKDRLVDLIKGGSIIYAGLGN